MLQVPKLNFTQSSNVLDLSVANTLSTMQLSEFQLFLRLML